MEIKKGMIRLYIYVFLASSRKKTLRDFFQALCICCLGIVIVILKREGKRKKERKKTFLCVCVMDGWMDGDVRRCFGFVRVGVGK